MSFKITWRLHAICFVVSIAITLIFMNILNNSILGFVYTFSRYSVSYSLPLMFITFSLVVLLLTSIVHESIHGFMFMLFGGKVKYGFKGIYAYTQEVSGLPLSRTRFLLVLLTPITLISLLPLFIRGWSAGFICILNLLG